MKKLLLTTLLCFCVSAYAFNWKKLFESSDGSSFYIDIDSIKKINQTVYYWQLLDMIEPIDNVNSQTNKYKVDCVEEKQTTLSLTHYSQPMGKGNILGESTTRRIGYPEPDSVNYGVMQYACDNAK